MASDDILKRLMWRCSCGQCQTCESSAEIERLRTALAEAGAMATAQHDLFVAAATRHEEAESTLLAANAQIAGLREALADLLEECSCPEDARDDGKPYHEAQGRAIAALATPSPTADKLMAVAARLRKATAWGSDVKYIRITFKEDGDAEAFHRELDALTSLDGTPS